MFEIFGKGCCENAVQGREIQLLKPRFALAVLMCTYRSEEALVLMLGLKYLGGRTRQSTCLLFGLDLEIVTGRFLGLAID